MLTGKLHGGVGSLVDHINVNSLDLSTPQQKQGLPTPAAPASAPAPSALQAPAPQTQAPAPNNAADSLSVLAAPTIQARPRRPNLRPRPLNPRPRLPKKK